jgi:hypothetical protein
VRDRPTVTGAKEPAFPGGFRSMHWPFDYGVVIRPIESLPKLTNHSAPSGPAVMS